MYWFRRATAANEITRPALLVAFASLILASLNSTSLYFSLFALFFSPVSEDLGWSLATFPQGMLAFSVSYGLAAPLTGWLADRLGARLALTVGVALTTAGLIAVSLMKGGLVPLIGFSCVLGLGGAFVGVTTLAANLASHFEKGRGLAMGIVFGAGPMVAAGAFSPIVSAAISQLGWRTSYQGLAVIAGALSLLMVLLLPTSARGASAPRGPARGVSSSNSLFQALRSRNFRLIILVSVALPVVFGGVSSHLVAIATEGGRSAGFGATMLSAMFLAGVAGPVLAGAAIDWLGRPQALLPFIGAPVIGLFILTVHTSGALLILGSAFIGVGFSAWSGQTAVLITRYFGLRSAGAIVGITFAIGSFLLGTGPVVLGSIRVSYGHYAPALFVCMGIQSLAFLSVALLGRFLELAPDADADLSTGSALASAADGVSSGMTRETPQIP